MESARGSVTRGAVQARDGEDSAQELGRLALLLELPFNRNKSIYFV